mmetsp:Transcript_38064/g.95734  ORF Transcript_38064/g.95734 Transcript_38064/m.95734 type:complete len:234 (-) Transcript_38064:1885-2586(-)
MVVRDYTVQQGCIDGGEGGLNCLQIRHDHGEECRLTKHAYDLHQRELFLPLAEFRTLRLLSRRCGGGLALALLGLWLFAVARQQQQRIGEENCRGSGAAAEQSPLAERVDTQTRSGGAQQETSAQIRRRLIEAESVMLGEHSSDCGQHTTLGATRASARGVLCLSADQQGGGQRAVCRGNSFGEELEHLRQRLAVRVRARRDQGELLQRVVIAPQLQEWPHQQIGERTCNAHS